MKKTQTKAFSNLIVSVFLLGFELWAWLQTGQIKTVKDGAVQPSTFPRIMILGMTVFTVILLVQSIFALLNLKPGTYLAEKAESLNPFKDKGVLAALFVILLCAAYV
ncbi:MAG: hypothetical protein IKE03_08060 [Blautia sp.]|nr:hypothetical protein [Blautia sp.]